MKVTFENNLLTVVTDLSEASAKSGITRLVSKDDKGNDVYGVSQSTSGVATVDHRFLVTNAVIDGKLAVQVLLKDGTTLEEVKKTYGANLVTAKKEIAKIAAAVVAESATIDEIFAVAE